MSPPALPFSDESRTGVELELLAPPGSTRREVALALAGGDSARVEAGFKYYGPGQRDEAGRSVCLLTPAFRVLNPDGTLAATVVDDPTVRVGLRPGLPPSLGPCLQTDDVRLAKWIERRCWSASEALEQKLSPLTESFEGRWSRDRLVDRYGHTLVRTAPERHVSDSERVCELVIPPLRREERAARWASLFGAAAAAGAALLPEGALHLHLDAGPWRTTRRLAALLRSTEALRAATQSRRQSRFTGPLAPDVLRVAREADPELPFEVFAAALLLAGAKKFCDLNVLGAIEEFPVHPTLELRYFDPTLDARVLVSTVERVETFLLELAKTADAH